MACQKNESISLKAAALNTAATCAGSPPPSLAHLQTLLQLRDEHLKSVHWVEVLLLAQLLLLLL